MAIPPLPLEIIDLVIDQLREDWTTLRSCSLVCRAWVSRTRHHLFFIFNVRTESTPALPLLRSPLCTIHPHVRGLKFCIYPTDTAPMVTFIREIKARSTVQLLRVKTAPGTGLTEIDSDLQTLLSTLKNLRYLKLEYFRFDSPENRIRLFASLPALESLAMYGVDSSDANSHGEDGMYTMPPPTNLRHMFIGTPNIPHEIRWLTAHCRHPLTTLHLRSITPECIPIVPDYLRQSSQLQCISFDFCRWETPEHLQFDFMAQIDLTSHQDLRCLRLNSAQAVPILSELLPRVRSTHLEEIAVSTDGRHVEFSWADLREIFMSSAVRGLERLYVDEEHIDEILEVLPEFASRGVILPLREGDFGRKTAEISLSSMYP